MPIGLDVRNFDKRVWLAGGRDQVPEGFCRLARGVAPELTGSIKSMWPPQLLYANINALNLLSFNNNRVIFDGSKLYVNGNPLSASGFNGQRGTFVNMPPTAGLRDFLFMCGAGRTVKLDAFNNVTNWGIQPPGNAMTAANAAPETIVIDSFVAHSANWTPGGPVAPTLANEATIVAVGAGSLKINPGTGQWNIINTANFIGGAPPQDAGNFADGTISLPTDIVSFWFYFSNSSATAPNWLQIDFDVNDATFKKDYYTIIIGFQPLGSTTPVSKVNPSLLVTFQNTQWQQVFLQKSQFTRIGQTLNLDWTNLRGIRISGNTFTGSLYLDNLQISGGFGLGNGPAVQSGGVEYSYFTVFRNSTTGTQSNPQNTPSNVQGVMLNAVNLSAVPVSTDAQVTVRDLYRTSAETTGGGQAAFYLDTIYDNTTTTYKDVTADMSIPQTLTPWQKSVAVPPNSGNIAYYVDGGNGYIFKLITAGTTGPVPPQWVIPTATWSALSAFSVGQTVAPFHANGTFWKCTTAGTTGSTQPNWGTSGPLQDGSAIWSSLGTQNTGDGSAVWQFVGINSTAVLTNQAMLLDNAVVPATIQDCAGPFQGSMVTTHDTQAGFKGAVYISPPGRNEVQGTIVFASTDSDPCQKAVIFQEQLWILTTNRILRISGTYPNFTVTQVYNEGGTNWPATVLVTEGAVFYRGADGIRAFSFAQDRLIAFDPVAPLFRGYAVEDLPAFAPTVGGITRDEIFLSNEQGFAMALGHVRQFWRTFDVGFTAVYYEHSTNEILASYGGNVYLWEHPTLTGSPLAFDWEVQTGAVEVSSALQGQSQRLYLDINTGNQAVTPTLLVDNASFVLPMVKTATRQTIELPIQVPGFMYSVNLTANPQTGVIEVFRVALDLA